MVGCRTRPEMKAGQGVGKEANGTVLRGQMAVKGRM
jgi:hypothetical protein